MRRLLLGLISLACAACTIEPLDLAGRQCPCASGWVCDVTQNVCVRALSDASASDAGHADAGSMDATTIDAAMDAATIDAARVDAGSVDAGHDAGGGDGGTDAGRGDAGTLDSTSCDDVHAGAVFCDGFESGSTMPEWDGVSTETTGVGAWVATPVYRGGGAFRATSSAPSGRAYLEKLTSSGLTSGEVHLRAYVFVRSSPAISEGALLYATESVEPYDGISVQVVDGLISTFGWGMDYPTSEVFPTDRWVCVEIAVTIGATGSFAISVDGREVQRVTSVDTRVGSSYSSVDVGLTWTGPANPGGEVLVDEVVLDDAPIGCD